MKMRLIVVMLGVISMASIASCVFILNSNRNNAQSSACSGNLSQIAAAMHSYHEKYGHFPPATTANQPFTHSWRVLLLEFIDHDLFERYHFDEPWDSVNNRQLQLRMPSCYCCPVSCQREQFSTSYCVVIGESTVFPGMHQVTLDDLVRQKSEIILVIEDKSLRVNWMEPIDATQDSLKTIHRLSIHRPSVTHACMADGTVRYVDDKQVPLMVLIK